MSSINILDSLVSLKWASLDRNTTHVDVFHCWRKEHVCVYPRKKKDKKPMHELQSLTDLSFPPADPAVCPRIPLAQSLECLQ